MRVEVRILGSFDVSKADKLPLEVRGVLGWEKSSQTSSVLLIEGVYVVLAYCLRGSRVVAVWRALGIDKDPSIKRGVRINGGGNSSPKP